MSGVHFFGIRHHGPGCARSLVRAFDDLAPDCVLVEGPPECDDLIAVVGADALKPPVALLGYAPDDPRNALYYPFAEFSPEWQALRWARTHGAPARFIDLPLAHKLALESEREKAATQAAAAEPPSEEASTATPPDLPRHDPLNWLAEAAGYADSESWWNHMVEERGDGRELFAAIAEAMAVVRTEWQARYEQANDPFERRREALREAHMRQALRAAKKEGFTRIAVVCGAWHLSALQAEVAVKDDTALLKNLPKTKVLCTWVPWTYRNLLRASGYGAGIQSPGWYEHLWRSQGNRDQRIVGWLSRVAQLMRAKDLDCSSASLIEAARLSDTLAALRERPAPGLQELQEATLTVLSPGDESLLGLIGDALIVGDKIGAVPDDVPTVPLQRDLEAQQKTLRMKPEAADKLLDLDLRNDTDLARSQLLHRLLVIGVPWGGVRQVGKSAKGTFHEIWNLQWRPELVIHVIEASRWGQTVEQAATTRAIDLANDAPSLAALAELMDRVLLANLGSAIPAVTATLQARAATTADALQLLGALPPLANAFRYGTVRQTDASLLAHVLDGLIVRAAISLPLACVALDEEAAATMRKVMLDAHAAIRLRGAEPQTDAWLRALTHVAEQRTSTPLLQGAAARVLVDEGRWSVTQAGDALALHTSAGAEPAQAAAWLEGFLHQSAAALLHDAAFWSLIDAWLCGLSEEHFMTALPLVRRTFATLSQTDRRQLGERAARGAMAVASAATASPAWDAEHAALALPLLRRIFGVES